MNQPKQPDDVPAEGASPDNNPTGTTPHGIPEDLTEAKSKGRPASSREESEKAALEIEKD